MNGPDTPDRSTTTAENEGDAETKARADRDRPGRRLPRWLLRRKFIVNPRRQLRSALLVTAVSLIPVVILNFNLGYTRALEREVIFEGAPVAVERQVWEHDRNEAILVLAASLVYLFGVFALAVVETHQTSGAALGVVRHLRSIRDGRLDTRLSLRDSDNLQELTDPFNQMAIALQARSIRDAEALGELASDAAGLEGGEQIAERLRELAGDHNRRAGKGASSD